MSSLKRRFIPFGDFNPEAPEIDVPQLEVAENCLPLFGSYRSLRKPQLISEQADVDPATGAHSHLVTEEEYGKMYLRPTAYSAASPFWDGFGAYPTAFGDQVDDSLNTPWITIDDSGVDDGDFIAAGPREVGDKADARFKLTVPTRDPEPTDGGAGTEHQFRFRYQTIGLDVPTGNATLIDWELRDSGGVVLSGSETPAAGNDVLPEIVEEDVDLTLHDPDTLEVRFEVWQDGAEPQQEISPVATLQRDNWEKDESGTITVDNIHQAIDEGDPPDDDDLIRSDWVGLDDDDDPGSSTLEFRLDSAMTRPVRLDEGTWWIKVRYKHKYDKDGSSLTLYIQYKDGARYVDIITPTELDAPTTSFVTQEVDISGGDWANVPLDKWSDIRCKLQYRYTGDPDAGDPEEEQEIDATQRHGGVNGWETNSGATSAAAMVTAIEKDSGTGTFVHKQVDDDSKSGLVFKGFEGRTPADSTEKPTLHVRYKIVAPDNKDRDFQFWARAYVYGSSETDEVNMLSGTIKPSKKADGWKKITFTSQFKTIKQLRDADIDWETIRIEWAAKNSGEDDWDLQIGEMWLEIPGTPSDQNKCEISWLYSEIPSAAQVRIQKVECQLTADNVEEHLPGDIPVITVGTRSKLYTVDFRGQWTDVSRLVGVSPAGYDNDYGDSLAPPKGWSFTTYGNKIIASNYHDVLQKLDWGDTNFTDLTSGTAGTGLPVNVRGRFVATIRSFLVVANINPDSDGGSGLAASDARGYTIWWSAQGDPTEFYELDIGTLSTYAQLVALPGEITGMVGGEYGIIFKRNSVWRMNWVGVPSFWTFDQISASTGCAFPGSIVSVGNTVYFWGPTGIFVLNDAAMMARSGQVVQKISTQIMDKYLFDTAFEDKPLRPPTSNQDVENLSVVSSGYDPYSGLVWWAYVKKGDPYYECNEILVYNPNDGKFTTVSPSGGLKVQQVIGIGNTYEEEQSYTRALALITDHPIDTGTKMAFQKFQSNVMYQITLKTKTLSSQVIAQRPGRQVQINQVRPVFRVNPENSGNPDIVITVDTAEDPSFQLNKTTNSVHFEDRNRDGWCPLVTPVSGEFFEFTVTVPETEEYILKEFLGLQLMYKDQGEI